MGVPLQSEARARGTGAVAHEIDVKSRRAQFALLCPARRRRDAPARPGGACLVERAYEYAARAVAFGEEEETARRFEFERLGPRGERANDDSARSGEPLLCGPESFLALAGADDDEGVGIEPELGEADGVRGALLGEDALLANPDQASLASPGSGDAQSEAQGGRLGARVCRAQLMQRRGRHLGQESPEIRGLAKGRKEGWTRTHVLYMF